MTELEKAARQALEALKECRCDPRLKYEHPNYDNIITALRRALAVSETHKQPAQQQEPVAWIVEDKYGERLEWAADADMGWGNKTEPLYTSPPTLSLAQRQSRSDVKPWVGLTDISELVEAELTHYWNGEYADTTGARDQLTDFARAIEAKLREKNGVTND